jgi:hypothetical protein
MTAFDDKFAIRLILIVILVVIVVVLVTQYNKKVATAPTQAQAKSVDQMINMGGPREHFADAPSPIVEANARNARTVRTPSPSLAPSVSAPMASGSSADVNESGVMSAEPGSNEDYMAIDFEVPNKTPGSCFPRDTNTPEDLIPKGAANSKWAQVMPAGQGDVKDQNYLTAAHHVGINTVGQSMRNANMQLRSDPPVPKSAAWPIMQSTIEYDNSRRHFEIGNC